jgi:hypothetical protein
MSPLNQKVARSSLVPPIFHIAKIGNKKIEGSSWAEQIMIPTVITLSGFYCILVFLP